MQFVRRSVHVLPQPHGLSRGLGPLKLQEAQPESHVRDLFGMLGVFVLLLLQPLCGGGEVLCRSGSSVSAWHFARQCPATADASSCATLASELRHLLGEPGDFGSLLLQPLCGGGKVLHQLRGLPGWIVGDGLKLRDPGTESRHLPVSLAFSLSAPPAALWWRRGLASAARFSRAASARAASSRAVFAPASATVASSRAVFALRAATWSVSLAFSAFCCSSRFAVEARSCVSCAFFSSRVRLLRPQAVAVLASRPAT